MQMLRIAAVAILVAQGRVFGACQELRETDIRLGRGTTLLYFYAPSCASCTAMKEPFAEVSSALIAKYGISGCYRIDVSGPGGEIADAFNIRTVPTIFVIHKVDAVYESADELMSALDPLMKTLDHERVQVPLDVATPELVREQLTDVDVVEDQPAVADEEKPMVTTMPIDDTHAPQPSTYDVPAYDVHTSDVHTSEGMGGEESHKIAAEEQEASHEASVSPSSESPVHGEAVPEQPAPEEVHEELSIMPVDGAMPEAPAAPESAPEIPAEDMMK